MKHETLAIPEVKSGKCGRCGETTWLTDRFDDGVKAVKLCADCGQKAQAYVEGLPENRQVEAGPSAPVQLPASLTVPEVGPVAACSFCRGAGCEVCKQGGPRGPYGRCTPHARLLTYKEQQAGCCWWCKPEKSPEDHSVRKLSREQLEKLIVVRV